MGVGRRNLRLREEEPLFELIQLGREELGKECMSGNCPK
jgi:hypothetical protein